MRNPEDIPPFGRRGRRRSARQPRTWVIVLVVVVVAILLSARALAEIYTDFLWFDSLGKVGVWRSILTSKALLVLAFTAVSFLVVYLNLLIADRSAPASLRPGPEDELLLRYRELVAPRQRTVRLLLSIGFGLLLGAGAAGQWNNWLLFRNGRSFGKKDPFLGWDVGFHIFKLPFLNYVVGWGFAVLIIVTLLTAAVHYLNGGIRLPVAGQGVTPQVKAHLSVLLAALALLKAGDYLLERSQLVLSTRGVVAGATYTDVNAQDPAIKLLVLISLLSAALFVVNMWKRGWALPIVAVALWAVVALVAGAAYPWFIQRFQVSRKESARESTYIRRNIVATRDGMGLSDVVEQNFDYAERPDPSVATEDADTIRNIRLLDPNVSAVAFQNLQSLLAYYKFPADLDVDRYPLEGQNGTTEMVLATRELNPDTDVATTWEQKHLIYTHGYGLAAAPANGVTVEGRPAFKVSGVNPIDVAPDASSLAIERPELYFGEGIDGLAGDGYAIVGTTRKEKSADTETTYAGEGGVKLTGLLRRAAYALRFGDLETLTSDYLTSRSRILYDRDVTTRVRQVAPFLALDHDPYPVVVGGRIKYVVDAYTTASTFPYGQQADTSQVDQGADLRDLPFNYIRNSVKAVVDAYDGDVTLYLSDTLYGEQDPLIRAYARAFPGLFEEDLPQELLAHLRYPEDLFRVQTAMWGRYHQDSAEAFYSNSDQWDVAQDPGNEVKQAESSGSRARVEPYYLQMRLPGDEESRFVLFRPFVQHSTDDSKKQLTSFMVAGSDPGSYGKLRVYVMTSEKPDGGRERNRDVDGPLTVDSRMRSSREGNFSQDLTLLSSGGSKVQLGNLLLVPLGNSLVYVRPVYVSASANDAAPELRRVVVANGERTVVGDTLREALSELLGTPVVTQEAAPGDTGGEPTPGEPEEPTVDDPADLLAQAEAKFSDADAALKEGGAASLQTYAELTEEGVALVERARRALEAGGATPTAGSSSSTTSTTTTTRPDDSSSPSGAGAGSSPSTTIVATTTTGKA